MNPTETPTEPSGRDLARIALHNARKAAKTPAADKRADRRKRQSARRTDGRDPMALGAAITHLMDDHAWEAPAAGGSIIDQWPTIAPELAGKVAAERFDATTGTLHLRPCSPAYGSQMRMFQRQMVERINAKAGSTAVRAIRVLAPGSVAPSTPAADSDPGPGTARPLAADAPVRTRDDAAPGFHRALAAINRTPPAGQKPRLERDWGTGEYAYLREPEHAFTDGQAALETAEASRGNDPAAVRQAAIRMARAEKAGRAPAVPTVFQRSA